MTSRSRASNPDETRIEQAIARWGTPYKAAERLQISDDQALAVWHRMLAANSTTTDALFRKQPKCGTYAAYLFHRTHGEPIDTACRIAQDLLREGAPA